MLDLSQSDPAIEALNAHLLRDGGKWPLKCEQPILAGLNTWAALAESDKDLVRKIAGWTDPDREYRLDPLPERIVDTWAAYLWGDDPRVMAGNEGDQPLMDELLGLDPTGGGANQLASELERAAGIGVGEGEVWSRIYLDPTEAPRPLLEWHTRRHIVPLWRGPRLLAAAIWTELPAMPGDDQAGKGKKEVWRSFECHAPGVVVNVLYRGGASDLGQRVPLEFHPATAVLVERWQHDLPGMLIERIPNRLRGNVQLGISEFAGIKDFLLDLNECATIGAANMKLTARKRAIISASVAQAAYGRYDETLTPEESPGMPRKRPRFDSAEDVFVADPLDAELGRSSGKPIEILEYSFDAQALIDWRQDLVQSVLSRVALTGQYVGTAGDQSTGYAISGTAIRLRLIPTDKSGRAKARYWDDALPKIIGNMVRLDAAPEPGYGRAWSNREATPLIERQPGIPTDEIEEAQRHSTLVAAGLESTETAVAALNPNRNAAWVAEEVGRIQAEQTRKTPGTIGSIFGA